METNHVSAAQSIDELLGILGKVANKHANDDVGKLTSSLTQSVIASSRRLLLNERKTSETARVSIASSVLLAVAGASRRRGILDAETCAGLRKAAGLAVSLAKPAKPLPQKSLPHAEQAPPSWSSSSRRIGGFERLAANGQRMHITKGIHAYGAEWVLSYAGVMIDTMATLEEASMAANNFENFLTETP